MIRERLRRARSDLWTLSGAIRHPDTPWYARAIVLVVIAYALSPIDLIPDPIPVLGLLDDAILVPLGILLALRCIPDPVLAACRAGERPEPSRTVVLLGGVLVVGTWLLLIALTIVAVRTR